MARTTPVPDSERRAHSRTPDGGWKTALTSIAPNAILIRGYPVDEMMGRLSFADAVYLLLMGELPSPAIGRMLNAVLVSSLDHGVTPPSTLAARNVATSGAPLKDCVASGILAFGRMGCRVTVCGPPTLIPRGVESLGCEVCTTLDGLAEADVVYALRMQRERMEGSFVPSLREYAAQYQIDGRRLGPNQLLMHPGPVNRGVELAAEVIDSPQALITQQVESGVVVRMAVLYELLAGGAPGGRATLTEPERTEPQPA